MKAILRLAVCLVFCVGVQAHAQVFSTPCAFDYYGSIQFLGGPNQHLGVDLMNAIGTPMFACGDGEVYTYNPRAVNYAGCDGQKGVVLFLIHHRADGSPGITQYGHLQNVPNRLQNQGAKVSKGEYVGELADYNPCCGRSGSCAHLHYGIWDSEEALPSGGWGYGHGDKKHWVDPFPFIANQNAEWWIRERNLTTVFGQKKGESHWFHRFDESYRISPANSDGTTTNCYIQEFNGASWNGAVVYDPVGNARRSYIIGWWQWETWKNLGRQCGVAPPGEGGPNSCLGMAITNSYFDPAFGDWVQDFQKGRIVGSRVMGYIGKDGQGTVAPGWGDDGKWHRRYSYPIADAYDRNGASPKVGLPSSAAGQSKGVHWWDDYLVQDFNGGEFRDCVVMYDPKNWVGNGCAKDEAHLLRSGFFAHYQNTGGPATYGCPTTDEITEEGKTVQYFYKWRTGKVFRFIWDSAENHVERVDDNLSPCNPNSGAGMGDGGNDTVNDGSGGGFGDCSPDPNNMIANHDFRDRTDCLDIRVWPPEHGEINFATNMIEVVVRGNNSDIWSAQLCFPLPRITVGQKYVIEYEQQNVKILETHVGLSNFENGQYYDCGFAESYTQQPEAWVPHRYEFVAKRTTSVAKLAFGFGRIDGSMFRLRPIRMYPISTPPPTCVLDPNSYIGNGNFTNGAACWTPRYINLQWPSFTIQDDHSARLGVNGGNNYYEYTLLQPCAPLPTNRQLQLDLTLGAASPCSVFVAVGSEARHNFHLWKGYTLRQLVDLPVHETITVTNPNPTDTLYVYAGKSPSVVWVKGVSLKDGVITPPITCTPDPGSLISSRAECFRVEKPDGLYADVINADNGPQIRVKRRGPIEQVKVTQAIPIQAGTDYLLTGTLSASSPGTVRIKIGNAAEQKWLAQADYHLGTYVPQSVNLTFRNERTTGPTHLCIMGGDTEGSVWFDRPKVAVKPLICTLDPNSYIGNGNFTNGAACWTPRYINLQWPSFTVQDDHSARLGVNGGNNYYEYTLLQSCAQLPTNRQLQLDLTLGAASPCSVFVAVGSEARHNFHLWKGYALRQLVDLPIHETITVTTPNPTDTLYVYAGKSPSSVWVKRISLKDGIVQATNEAKGEPILAPNPMKGAGTVMRLTLENPANVLAEVYNVSGQRVRVLYDGQLQPGPRSIFWDGQDEHGTRVPSGLYFTRCRMNDRTYSKTLIVVR